MSSKSAKESGEYSEVKRMAEHVLERGRVHYKWDNSIPPAIEIARGL